MYVCQWSNSFSNTDHPVGGRPAGTGVTVGKVREEKSAGTVKTGAEEGGE